MKRQIAVVVALVLTGVMTPMAQTSAAPALDQGPHAAAPSPAGRWRLVLETPHGQMAIVITVAIDAKDGKTATGTMVSDLMGEIPFAGAFAGGKLTFTIVTDQGDLRFVGTLKDADTMASMLSSHQGDLAGVATRLKEK